MHKHVSYIPPEMMSITYRHSNTYIIHLHQQQSRNLIWIRETIALLYSIRLAVEGEWLNLNTLPDLPDLC